MLARVLGFAKWGRRPGRQFGLGSQRKRNSLDQSSRVYLGVFGASLRVSASLSLSRCIWLYPIVSLSLSNSLHMIHDYSLGPPEPQEYRVNANSPGDAKNRLCPLSQCQVKVAAGRGGRFHTQREITLSFHSFFLEDKLVPFPP